MWIRRLNEPAALSPVSKVAGLETAVYKNTGMRQKASASQE